MRYSRWDGDSSAISLETLSLLAGGDLRALPDLRRRYQGDYEELAQLTTELNLSRLPPSSAPESLADPPRAPAKVIELHPAQRSDQLSVGAG